MIFYYAQVDENGVCICVSQLAGEVDQPDMIRLDEFDASVLGKRWDGENWNDWNEEESEKEGNPETE